MTLLLDGAIDRIIDAGRRLNESRREQSDAPDEPDPVVAWLPLGLSLPPSSPEPKIDKVRLATDLEAVAKEYQLKTAHRRTPSQRQMHAKLRKLAGLVASLRKELGAVERESWLRIHLECRAEAYAREHGSDPELPPHPVDFGDVIGLDFRGGEALARGLAAVRRLDEWLARSGPYPELEFVWRKQIEQCHDRVSHWLFGHALADVYQRHFLHEAGVSRPSEGGGPVGPYVRFALSAAKEVGVRKTTGDCYGTETVAKAQRCPDDCPGYRSYEWERWIPSHPR